MTVKQYVLMMLIFLSAFFVGTKAFAQSSPYSISTSGNLTLYTNNLDYSTTQNDTTGFVIYLGTYPLITSAFGVATDDFNGYTIRDIVNDNFASTTCTFISTTINCNLNNLLGTPATGQYWARLTSEQNGNPEQTQDWYPFNFNGTQWTPATILPLTGQTRIVNISPESGTIASTTQTFITTLESATPTLTKSCIVWQRVSNFASYEPQKYCENNFTQGSTQISTTTSLVYNESYLYKTELYTTSTTTPAITSEVRYLTVGQYQWSPLFDDTASTTPIDPTTFCDGFSDISYGICKVVMYVMAVPQQIITGVYSMMVSTIQNTPPVSWFYQIKDQLESIEYLTATNTGFEMTMPFETTQEFLTTEQLNTWTGGYLGALRTLTTISIIVGYLIYLLNRVLYRIF